MVSRLQKSILQVVAASNAQLGGGVSQRTIILTVSRGYQSQVSLRTVSLDLPRKDVSTVKTKAPDGRKGVKGQS